MERKLIGSFIAALRRASGMTQKELAEKLSVSDKAVSRWERDESLPDLMLLPVIADVFHISVDELLRGERKQEINAPQAEKPDTEAETARLKKQTKRVLAVQLARLRNRLCIAICVGLVGMLAACVCNFAFSKGFVGFLTGAFCLAAAALMTALFSNGAWHAVDEEDYDENSVRAYRTDAVRWIKRACTALTVMLCFCLPMALAAAGNLNGYSDTFIPVDGWVLYSAVCLALAGVILSYVYYRIDLRLIRNELICEKKNIALHGWFVKGLSAVMLVTLAGRLMLPDLAYLVRDRGEKFHDVDAFVAEMESRWAYQKEHGYMGEGYMSAPASAVAYYDQDGNAITEEQAALHELYDHEGNVIAQYHQPYDVAGVRTTFHASQNSILIECYTYNDLRNATKERERAELLIMILFVTEPLLAYGAYRLAVLKRNGRT